MRALALTAALLLCASGARGQEYVDALSVLAAGGGGGGPAAPPTYGGDSNVSGTASACTPGEPTGSATGDLILYVIETIDTQAGALVSGEWTQVTGSPIDNASDTRLTVFYTVHDGSVDYTNTDAGDHNLCVTIRLATSGTFNSSSPFDQWAEGTESATTSLSMPDVTLTEANQLVLSCVSGEGVYSNGDNLEFSSWTNGNLSSVTEIADRRDAAGADAAIGCVIGTAASSGAVGNTTATAATSDNRAKFTLSVRGAP